MVAVIGPDIIGGRQAGGGRDIGGGAAELRIEDHVVAVMIAEAHANLHRPCSAGIARQCPDRALHQPQRGDARAVERKVRVDARHAGAQHILAAERLQRHARCLAHRAEQILPRRVGIGVTLEKEVEAAAKAVLADQERQLLDDAGRLEIDDRAVIALGSVEIVQRLPQGRGAAGLVRAIGLGLYRQEEGGPGIAVRLQLGLKTCGHEGGEALLQPQIVEPAHGDEIAEPLVADLVIDGLVAAEALGQRRRLAKDEAVLVVEDGADMFHAAEGEGGGEQQVELGEGEGDGEPGGEPVYGGAVGGDLGLGIDLGAAGGAGVEGDRLFVRGGGGPVRPGAGGEGGEIGGDGLGFRELPAGCGAGGGLRLQRAVGDRGPVGRGRQVPAETGLQVRLVETGKEQVGVGRHEQRVEIGPVVGIVVEADDGRARGGDRRLEPGGQRVAAGAQQALRQDHVAVAAGVGSKGTAVDHDVAEQGAAEIEY